MNEDVLPALSFSHDLQLSSLMVDVLGQVPVVSNTSDLWVVLELLLQLLAVVDGLPLPCCQLRDRREVLCRLQLHKKKLMGGLLYWEISRQSLEKSWLHSVRPLSNASFELCSMQNAVQTSWEDHTCCAAQHLRVIQHSQKICFHSFS